MIWQLVPLLSVLWEKKGRVYFEHRCPYTLRQCDTDEEGQNIRLLFCMLTIILGLDVTFSLETLESNRQRSTQQCNMLKTEMQHRSSEL